MQKIDSDQLLLQISARLRQERERLGLTIEAFAHGGGLTQQTQMRYENGSRMPDAKYLANIHQLNVDVLYVLSGKKTPRKSTLSPEEAELLDRHRNLPTLLRRHVENTALLAWLAYQDRKGYHLNEGGLQS